MRSKTLRKFGEDDNGSAPKGVRSGVPPQVGGIHGQIWKKVRST